jgi:hypothetical protein
VQRFVLGLLLASGCFDLGSLRPRDLGGSPDLASDLALTAGGERNLAFVTSTVVSPADLVAMGSGDPLAGGDKLCNQSAHAAGLPGTYVAWLSNGSFGARDRMGNAQGFWRTDGRPFTDSIGALVGKGQIFYPLELNEYGAVPTTQSFVHTATSSNGTPSSLDCNHFTDTSSSAVIADGTFLSGGQAWTSAQGVPCTAKYGIYCFGTDYAQAVVLPSASGYPKAFVSSSWIPGGGLASADAKCNQDAQMSGLSGTFLALLATETATAVSRFDLSRMPWVRLDGVLFVNSRTDLAKADLASALNVASDGSYVNDRAWIGYVPNTTGSGHSCASWTSSSASGDVVPVDVAGNLAGYRGTVSCSAPYRLFCLEN